MTFWQEELKASDYVLNIIKYGYKIPFTSIPPPTVEKNNASALRNADFVETELQKLLADGRILRTRVPPHTVNPLSVSEGTKSRLVLDLRNINPYVILKQFKYENLKTLADLFEKNYHFASFDLKNGYHHIRMAPEYQKYLGFAWTYTNGQRFFYFFTVLPFGLSSACYVFTKITRPLTKKWRSAGIRSLMYIDDGIFGSPDALRTQVLCDLIRSDVSASGFTINEEKSKLYPVQKGEWLGFEIDTGTMEFSVPLRKIVGLKLLLDNALHRSTITPRALAKLAGKIISMTIAIGPVARLFTRQMYHHIEHRIHWDAPAKLNVKTWGELKFWQENLEQNNGYKIKTDDPSSLVLYCDASAFAFGGSWLLV